MIENNDSAKGRIPKSLLEKFAVHKQPLRGKCPESTMACGYHRIGLIPVMSVLDNGAAGCICRDICIDCGKRFDGPNHGGFILIDQPSKIGGCA